MVVRKSVSLAASFGFVLMGTLSAANAVTIFDTMPSWNGSNSIGNFGKPDTATYGQTFIAPIDPLFTSYTFKVNPERAQTLQFRGEVYSWTGSMLGGGGGGATGAMLYQSAPMTLTGNGTFQSAIIHPNISLTPGSHYVALLTVSDPADYAATTSTGVWGRINSHIAGSGGGGFVFDNNGNNHAALTAGAWDNFADFGDLAWRAEFVRGNAPVPEPGSVAMLVGMGLSGAGFLLRRRRAK